MKKLFLVALSGLMFTGCSLIPRDIEYFQRKVKPVPVLSESGKEHQRQAAALVAQKTQETKEAALATQADESVIAPASEAETVASALSTSLGPPKNLYPFAGSNLALTLGKDQAKLNSKVENYRKHVAQDVGKKIEGSGLFQVGYFTNAAIILGVLALLWFGIRVYGVMNPVVGGVTSTVGRVSGAVINRGFTEIVKGGELFKDYLANSDLDEKTAAYVKLLFSQAHQQSQSVDVKTVVSGITAYPKTTPPPLA